MSLYPTHFGCNFQCSIQLRPFEPKLQAIDRMRAKRQFSDDFLAALRDSRGLRIRARTGQHRFIGIWVVVVRDRAFVRSWSVKANGWYRTLLEEPRGTIQVADREIAVRAIRTKSEGLRDAVDRAYLDRYSTTSALKCQRPRPREIQDHHY